MTNAQEIELRIQEVRDALYVTHRASGRDLEQALKRATRLLPRSLRRDGRNLVAGQKMLGHPRLERMVDQTALFEAADRLLDHLGSVDVEGIRQRRLLGMFGLMAFYILFVGGAFLVWMVRAGYL